MVVVVEAILVPLYAHFGIISQLVLMQQLFGWRRVRVFRYDEALLRAVTGSGCCSVSAPASVPTEEKGNYVVWLRQVIGILIDTCHKQNGAVTS
jgi:hypothetical protein